MMPSQDQVQTRRKAKISLDFIVIGAGIAGLATAYALRESGHSVLVAEKSDGTFRSKSGIRSPPNMTKILNQWGLGPALSKISHKCTSYKLRNGCNGDYVGAMYMTESFQRHLLADFLFVQHGDIHTLIHDLANEAGAKFLWDAEVVSADSEHGTVTLKDGQVFKADVIVAADGYDSNIRPQVAGSPESEDDLNGQNVCLAFQVPASLLREDEGMMASLTDSHVWSLWLGDGYTLSGNLLPGGTDATISLVYRYHLPLSEGDDKWGERAFEQFQLDYSKFEPRLLKLFKSAKNITGRVFRTRSPVDSLVCDRSRVVLVGEAGRPLTPSGHHSTALGIEDAQTLALLFSRVRSRDQVPQFLNAFEEIRQPRVSTTQSFEAQRHAMFTVPAGPLMTQRDDNLRSALAYEDWEHMDEEVFRMVWENELALISHDAEDKVADWWTQWRSYFEQKGKSRRPTSVQVSVSRGETNLSRVKV